MATTQELSKVFVSEKGIYTDTVRMTTEFQLIPVHLTIKGLISVGPFIEFDGNCYKFDPKKAKK